MFCLWFGLQDELTGFQSCSSVESLMFAKISRKPFLDDNNLNEYYICECTIGYKLEYLPWFLDNIISILSDILGTSPSI